MNQKELEKLIWKNVVVYLQNLDDLDGAFYEALRNGVYFEEMFGDDLEPIGDPVTEAHQNRFDIVLQTVIARARRYT